MGYANYLKNIKFRLFDKDTEIPKVKPFDWDVLVKDTPYYVASFEGFIHTIGGKYGINDLWAWPRNEEPTYENLIEFNGEPVCWGVQSDIVNYTKSKWDETEILSSKRVIITRNGEKFDSCFTLNEALYRIENCKDHPLDLQTIDFDKKMIGRKVWWRSEPGIITMYCKGQASVIIELDGIENFTTPAEYTDEDSMCYVDKNVKVSIFDESINYFRD